MRTKLCDFCLRTGILCARCRQMVERGEVDRFYIEVAREILRILEGRNIHVDFYLDSAFRVDDVLVVMVGEGDIAKLRPLLRMLRDKLEKRFGVRRVKFLEFSRNKQAFLEELFYPWEILTINTVWLPDGSKVTRVVLRREGRRAPNYELLKEIARRAMGITLRVEEIPSHGSV